MNQKLVRLRARARGCPRGRAEPWPGVTSRISEVFSNVLANRIPANQSDVRIKKRRYFHRQTYTAAGMTELTAFNANATTKFVTNLAGGTVPNETAFALQAVHVGFRTGVTLVGAADAAGSQIISETAANASLLLAEQVRRICENGQLQLKVGDALVIDAYDLTNFPLGHGFWMAPAAAGASAATQVNQVLPFNNGFPGGNDGWKCTPWYPVLPGKVINLTINWQNVLAVTTAVLVVNIELEGIEVTPANL